MSVGKRILLCHVVCHVVRIYIHVHVFQLVAQLVDSDLESECLWVQLYLLQLLAQCFITNCLGHICLSTRLSHTYNVHVTVSSVVEYSGQVKVCRHNSWKNHQILCCNMTCHHSYCYCILNWSIKHIYRYVTPPDALLHHPYPSIPQVTASDTEMW